MLWTNIKRVMRAGFFSFWRNSFVSLASVLIMIIALSVLTSIIIGGSMLDSTMKQIQDKVDINVYFIPTASESDILALEDSLKKLPEVSEITYISREQALENFKLKHENDQYTIQSLEELDDNPLGAVFNIKATNPLNYEGIANYLKGANILSRDGSTIVDKVNYYQNKETIDKLAKIMNGAKKMSFGLAIVLIVISIVITFNTIRLAIYISKDEIGVMRLVGASSTYIKGPFITVGIMYGVISGVITMALFYPITFWLGDISARYFVGFDIFKYYVGNFGMIFGIVIGSGAFIGAVSSFLSVRKYLKV